MKTLGKTLFSVLISGGLLAVAAPAAQAQTYIYPITPNYSTTGYAAPSYSNYGTTAYGATGYGTAGCFDLTNYLTLGSSDAYTGGQVTVLQEFLNRTGYLNGVTGNFDQGTYGAVVNYQLAHGISPTGTVGPITRAAINEQSCSGYSATPTPIVTPTPVPTPIVSPGNCYYENGINECSNCNNEYTNGSYYNNEYPYDNNNCGVSLDSVNASYNNGSITLTLNGYGFTSSDTVYFDNSSYSGYSSNGTTLTVTVPNNNYYSGNYDIYVETQSGASSNTISFPLNSYSYSNGNGTSGSISLSNISGPTSVQSGTTNNWSINVSNNNNGYYPNNAYNNNPYATVTVNWGDNTSSNSQSVYSSGSQELTFNHEYLSAGTYTINVSANENGSNSYQTLTVYVSGNGGNNYYGGTPSISYLSPNSGYTGSSIQIIGSGFSSYGNTVHFGSGGEMNLSSNGSTIYYTVPNQTSGCDLSNGSYCAQWVSTVTPGSYPIYVTNSSGQSSNTLYFQVN